jgi:hypothetical protein
MENKQTTPRDPQSNEVVVLEFQRQRLQRLLAVWMIGTAISALAWGWGSVNQRTFWGVCVVAGLVGLVFQAGRLVQTKAITQRWEFFGFRRTSASASRPLAQGKRYGVEADAELSRSRRTQGGARVFASLDEAAEYGWSFSDKIGQFGNAPLHRFAWLSENSDAPHAESALVDDGAFEYVGLLPLEGGLPTGSPYMKPDFRIFGRLVYHQKKADSHASVVASFQRPVDGLSAA